LSKKFQITNLNNRVNWILGEPGQKLICIDICEKISTQTHGEPSCPMGFDPLR